jgi:hypothetical protein
MATKSMKTISRYWRNYCKNDSRRILQQAKADYADRYAEIIAREAALIRTADYYSYSG